jgi:hypothetical protein
MQYPVDLSQLTQQATDGPVDRILRHLRRHPQDLVDARRLMHSFQVSVHEFQRALERLAQETTDSDGAMTS